MRRPRLDATRDIGVGKASSLGVLGSLAQSLMRTLTNVGIGRIAGPASLGVVSSAISLGNLLVLMWPATAGNAASKFVARAHGSGDPEELAAAANHIGKRTLASSLVVALTSVPLWVLINGGSPVSGAVVALLVFGLGAASYARGVHYGIGQIPRSTVWEIATGALGLAGTFVVLSVGLTDGIVILAPIALSYLLYTFACWPRGNKGRPDKVLRREIDTFIAVGTLGTLASAGFLHLSVIAVRAYGDAYEAGQYAAALALATPVALLARALSMALYPRMARDYGSGSAGDAAGTARRFTLLLIVLLVPSLGLIAIFRDEVVQLIWGSEFQSASATLPILLLAVFLTSIRVPAVGLLSTGPQRGIFQVTIFSIIGLSSGVIIWLLTLGALQIVHAVAAGYACGALLTTLLSVVSASRGEGRLWLSLGLRGALGVALATAMTAIPLASHTGKAATAGLFITVWVACNFQAARSLMSGSTAAVGE